MPRQKVRNILMAKLKRARIRWGHKLVDMETVPDNSSLVNLTFQTAQSDTTIQITADFVVGADGIRSTVVQKWLPTAPPPKPMGVRLILGLSRDFEHPLLHERGFYTLAPGMRLFVMPFSVPPIFKDVDATGNDQTEEAFSSLHSIQYMWQLSMACPLPTDTCSSDSDKQRTASTASYTSKELQQQALDLTRDWHEPVPDLIRSTPVASIWGAHLCDQDPLRLSQLLLQRQEHALRRSNTAPRVVLAGDALHAMSCFKGQGANQSLADGVTIAQWIVQATPESAVKGCLREMVARTAPVVKASREAAQYWHDTSPTGAWQNETARHFASVEAEHVERLLQDLCERGITAETANLDERIQRVLLQEKQQNQKETSPCCTNHKVPLLAKKDDTGNRPTERRNNELFLAAFQVLDDRSRLRELSWREGIQLHTLRDPVHGGTLVHAAVTTTCNKNNAPDKDTAWRTVHWLVTEAGCPVHATDALGRTAADLAKDDIAIRQVLEKCALQL